MRPFLAFVLLSLLTIQKSLAVVEAKSFPGYYITNAGDTIYAKFLPISENLYREVFFSDSSDRVVKFKPHQIKAFSATSPKRTIFYCSYGGGFAKLYVDGPLTLIYYLDHINYGPYGGKDFRLCLMNDTMIRDVYQLSFRKDVLPFIKDYPELAAKVESKKLKDIMAIVKQYNLWVEEKKKANTQQQPSNN